MFAGLITKVKGALLKMGLIKDIKNVSSLSSVQDNEAQYSLIEQWLSIYSGYLGRYTTGGKIEEFHDVSYYDVYGAKKGRRRATLNMARAAAHEMAKLVFNEKCAINVAADDYVKEAIETVLKEAKFISRFQNQLEYMFAGGGLVIKPYWDNGIKITFVRANAFLPTTIIDDQIFGGVFPSITKKDDKYYTLLEWHDWNSGTITIRNELYMSMNAGSLGTKVPLSVLYPDKEESIVFEGMKNPLFVYIKPNIANNFEMESPLGVSIFANAIDTLKTIDIAFDSFQREFILGKKRIMVPNSAIRVIPDPNEPGKMLRFFDASDEVYTQYQGDGGEGIQEMQSTLRIEEHISAINALLNYYSSQVGFSNGTFAFTGGATAITATQVISENSDTYQSKSSHEIIIEQGIIQMVHTIVELLVLYKQITVSEEKLPDIEVTVDFDDSVLTDKQTDETRYTALVNAKLMPKVQAIMRIFDLPEEEAIKWLQQIQSENAVQVSPEMMDLFGISNSNVANNGATSSGGVEESDNQE